MSFFRIIACGNDSNVHVWDRRVGKLPTMSIPAPIAGDLNSIQLSRDEQVINRMLLISLIAVVMLCPSLLHPPILYFSSPLPTTKLTQYSEYSLISFFTKVKYSNKLLRFYDFCINMNKSLFESGDIDIITSCFVLTWFYLETS